MNFLEEFVDCILVNALTLFYIAQVLLLFFIEILKNPFQNPWATKLNSESPAALRDPKYGVHKYIKVNNINLHYVESGDPSKPLMLFIHGFPEFWYTWRHQILHFNKDYRVVAVDLRGYGDSEKPEDVSSYKIEYIVEDIRDLIRILGHDKCIVVSHDWGGAIACRLREDYPEVLHALVVMASASSDVFMKQIKSSSEQRKKSWYMYMFRFPKVPELLFQMNDLEFFDKTLTVKEKNTIKHEDLECYKYCFRKQMAFTPPINYYRANFGRVRESKTFEENIPFLHVLAANDPAVVLPVQDEMKNKYKIIETAIIDNCGHFIQYEEPEKINTIVRDFLAKYNF